MNRKPQNAIMLAYDFYPSEGGIQTLMRSMVTAKIGITWTVLTRNANKHMDQESSHNVVRTAIRPQLRIIDKIWLKMRRGRFTLPELIAYQTSRKLIRLGRRTNADFLFADQLCSAFSVRDAARKLGIPWGMGVYGKELLDMDQESRRLLVDADFALACSAYSKELAISRGAVEDQISVLNPCVNTDFYRPPSDRIAARRELGVHGRETLVTVAHLVPRKGHEQVIQALPDVKEAFPNVIYLVVGRGQHERSLRNLAEDLGVSELVKFCGYVPTQELPGYYGATDIHIMASTCDGDVEGFGISFIEAAACGTPSIGSHSGGIPDAIFDGKTGFLVEPGDVNDLSKKIVKMLSDDNLRVRMGYAARERVLHRFSENSFEQTLMNALQKTILPA